MEKSRALDHARGCDKPAAARLLQKSSFNLTISWFVSQESPAGRVAWNIAEKNTVRGFEFFRSWLFRLQVK